MILALGNSSIYEIEYFNLVLQFIKDKGQNAILFKQDKCLEGEYLDYEVAQGSFHSNIIVDRVKYNLNDITSVWYLKPFLPLELINYPIVEYREFIRKQFKDLRESLFTLLSNKKWLPNPNELFKYSNKILQLELALSCGFCVPDTYIGSNPEKAKQLFKKTDSLIVKQLASNLFFEKAIYTNLLNKKHIGEIESLKLSPCIFQEYIEKDFDIRVTFINGKIFASKIISQNDPGTSIDWRRKPQDIGVEIESYNLCEEIQENILRFTRKANLNFGCFDFVKSKSGKIYFLEVNPNGQWYFVDEKNRIDIAFEIANFLCS